MSHSSNTTLISPTATLTAGSHQQSTMPPPPTRRTSHGAHHTVHHHAHKRRQGSSTHLHSGHHGASHAHAAPHAGPSGNRRSSEGESGRRAMAAGLTMASMEPGKPKRKGSGDRPSKNSRSDPNLTTLSRVNSRHSTSSSRHSSRHSSRANSPTRPATGTRQRSDTSVQLDDAGNPTVEVDSGEEGWEDEAKRSRQETPKADETLRRTKSDPHTSEAGPSKLPTPMTRKTTGFAGPTQTPDPLITTYSHALNDPTHIMPAHQIKHQQSARSLHAYQAQAASEGEAKTPSLGRRSDGSRRSMPGMSRNSSRSSVKRTESPGVGEVPRVESGLSMTKTAGETPSVQTPTPQTELPTPDQPDQPKDMRILDDITLSTSPSYPFPRPLDPPALSESPSTIVNALEQMDSMPRSRQISGTSSQPRTLRHRYSNSSIRSIQSLRAPPHPLNSPTGYRTGIHPAASTQTSPRRSKGPSMHHPPIAPPVVSSDVANGLLWDGVPDTAQPRLPSPPPSVYRHTQAPSTAGRTSSFSSIRSSATLTGSTATSSRPQANRRPTAFEATAKASRLRSTADPAAYHASLGLSPATADTAHLISRFLPPPKINRPDWEISPAAAHGGYVGIGLTNGDYREAHEALVRTMMTMGVAEKPAMGRAASYVGRGDGALGSGAITPRQAGMSISSIDEVVGVGTIKSARGGMVVGRGGWEGRTPFLLSVDRCLAQKPVRGVPGI